MLMKDLSSAFQCPGSSLFVQPVPETVKCPLCNEDVEIWSDESKASCPKCGVVVRREMKNNCLDWCKKAEECVGKDVYQKYIENKSKDYKK
ncbi:MAG: hypothetical protein V1660_04155 [archaeon]